MSWYRTSDNRPLNKKIRKLSDGAYRLDDQAGHYCNRQRTDGLVTVDDLEEICLGIKGKRIREYVAELVESVIWHASGAQCESEFCPAHYALVPQGSWARHDHLQYQPTRDEMEAMEVKKRDAGRLGGIASGLARRSRREAERKAQAEADAKQVLRDPLKQTRSRREAEGEADAKLPARASRPVPLKTGVTTGLSPSPSVGLPEAPENGGVANAPGNHDPAWPPEEAEARHRFLEAWFTDKAKQPKGHASRDRTAILVNLDAPVDYLVTAIEQAWPTFKTPPEYINSPFVVSAAQEANGRWLNQEGRSIHVNGHVSRLGELLPDVASLATHGRPVPAATHGDHRTDQEEPTMEPDKSRQAARQDRDE